MVTPNAAPPARRSGVALTIYEEHRAYVLGVVGRRCGWLGPDECEAMFHDAFAILLEKERGGAIDLAAMNAHQVRAYLTQTALNKALDEGKRAHRKRSVALEDGGLEAADETPAADDLLMGRHDGARLREIVAELPDRQQAVVALRYFFDRTPEEIQAYLGVTERVYRREMERAMRTLSERMEQVRSGSFCESRRSLILAYVSGIAGPNRMRDARRHLSTCTACARWAFELREAARHAGAAVPLPVVLGASLGGDGHGLLTHGHALRGLRERLGDLVAGGRGHVAGVATRAADPATGSVLGSVRPGTVAAVVAGCLGVGSSATYCAFQGLPLPRHHHAHTGHPLRAAAAKARPAPPIARAPAATTAASQPAASATTKPTVKVKAKTKATTSTTHRARQHALARAVERQTAPEFGIEAATPTATKPLTSPPTTASTDSSGGHWGTEFGP